MRCPRTKFVVAGLRLPALCCKPLLASIFRMILFAILVTPLTLAQQQSKSLPGPEHKAQLPAASVLTTELQSRLQALESAKQSGDPVAIANASRSVVGLALREIAGLELIQGSELGAGRSARPTRLSQRRSTHCGVLMILRTPLRRASILRRPTFRPSVSMRACRW